jgi:hypothetical protein
VEEVFASAVRPTKQLINDDLPTFDRPMNAYSGTSAGGHSFG